MSDTSASARLIEAMTELGASALMAEMDFEGGPWSAKVSGLVIDSEIMRPDPDGGWMNDQVDELESVAREVIRESEEPEGTERLRLRSVYVGKRIGESSMSVTISL